MLQKRHISLPQVFSVMNKQVWERFDPNEKDLVKLEDVAGMKEAKIEVLEFVDFLKVSCNSSATRSTFLHFDRHCF